MIDVTKWTNEELVALRDEINNELQLRRNRPGVGSGGAGEIIIVQCERVKEG